MQFLKNNYSFLLITLLDKVFAPVTISKYLTF